MTAHAMMQLKPALLAVGLIACACQDAASPAPPQQESKPAPSYDDGLPEFDSVEEAIAFAVEEQNLGQYGGLVFGSERYDVALPSGAITSNWQIDCYFGALFRGFGEEAFPDLAPLLDHEHEFVQVGAYSVLNSYMYAHGLKRHTRQTRDERIQVMDQLVVILEREGG